MERWLKIESVAEERKSEGITNREHKKNKIPEDDKSVAADTRTCDLSPRKNTDFETQSCEIPGKPWPEVWTASQWAKFKGKYTWLIIGQNGKLGCNTCYLLKA
jgi:hypothetical protein